MIHARAVIGKNCKIGSCVTIGGRGKHYEVPVIGDNVQISTGSKILGPVHIGTMLSLVRIVLCLKIYLQIV